MCSQGKVRDTYTVGDKVVIVTTDRQSAFDRLLASVPFKGQVLTHTSVWWFQETQHLVRNALLACPDPNIVVMQRCEVLPVEFVVRGFVSGSTETSLWSHYKQGTRRYCGNELPDGLCKNDRLPENLVTPTTKAADRDLPISPAEIVEQVHFHLCIACTYSACTEDPGLQIQQAPNSCTSMTGEHVHCRALDGPPMHNDTASKASKTSYL